MDMFEEYWQKFAHNGPGIEEHDHHKDLSVTLPNFEPGQSLLVVPDSGVREVHFHAADCMGPGECGLHLRSPHYLRDSFGATTEGLAQTLRENKVHDFTKVVMPCLISRP